MLDQKFNSSLGEIVLPWFLIVANQAVMGIIFYRMVLGDHSNDPIEIWIMLPAVMIQIFRIFLLYQNFGSPLVETIFRKSFRILFKLKCFLIYSFASFLVFILVMIGMFFHNYAIIFLTLAWLVSSIFFVIAKQTLDKENIQN